MKEEVLTLTRQSYYADCTIGVLADGEQRFVCLTLEPPCRLESERKPLGLTAIPEGNYLVTVEEDNATGLRYFRLGKVKSFARVFLKMGNGYEANPTQTRGDILVGMVANNELGRLEDCMTAYQRLMHVCDSCIENHARLRLKVKNEGFGGRVASTFVPPMVEDWDEADE